MFNSKYPDADRFSYSRYVNVSFDGTHPLYRKRMTVVIGGEMPHWVKKSRNAFDKKSRGLVFRGKERSLLRIYNIWKASGDADVKGGDGL
jgi:hypothetical protein